MNTMNFRVAISSDRFTYNSRARCFVSEASDLHDCHLQQLYPDACDVGFVMQSARTQTQAEYYLHHVHKDREGDITHWEYRPTSFSQRNVPNCVGTTVQIFND